jgi:hypothetical protein
MESVKAKTTNKSRLNEPLLSIWQAARKVDRVKIKVRLILLLVLGGGVFYLVGCGAHAPKESVSTRAEGEQTLLSSPDVSIQQSQGPTSLETFNAFLDRS